MKIVIIYKSLPFLRVSGIAKTKQNRTNCMQCGDHEFAAIEAIQVLLAVKLNIFVYSSVSGM